MIKVSVIIPVYNVANYLNDCIHSLLNQTLKEIEFIFVNDGSSDNSQEIIEKYKKQDSRISLINQKNAGVSVARNNGIKLAKGLYIGFVDGDDFVEKDMFEVLFNETEKNDLDVVVSNFIIEQDGVKKITQPFFATKKIFNKQKIQCEIIPFLIKNDDLNTCCTKIFKNSFITENNINFPKGKELGEDALFNLQVFNLANNAIFTEYAGYHYREVVGSATRNILTKDYFNKALEVYRLDYIKNYNISLDQKQVDELKGFRFINTIISILHIYLRPNKNMGFKLRYKKVKSIINNSDVQEVLKKYYLNIKNEQQKYTQFILFCVKKKCMLGLILATSYSNYKNKL